jgi:SAM-dependent methyltransferase
VTATEVRYGFGKNWAEFIQQSFSEERIKIAQERLLNFLKLKDLRGRSFLDIGCGSGLHSLAAYRAGAQTVLSFDYDSDSVQTTRKLHEHVGSPSNWIIRQGSVLDRKFIDSLERADIVYSWGVLHHTGDMWTAIEHAVSALKQEGMAFIALYTKDVCLDPGPDYWLDVKQAYNQAGPLRRKWMEWAYVLRFVVAPELYSGRNPLRYILTYKKSRGMSFWIDVKDWLGGWPMEFAGIAETKDFCCNKLGLELLNVNAGEANTEYLFRRKGSRNYWDDVLLNHSEETLPAPFAHRAGAAWTARLVQYRGVADSLESRQRSRLMLYEDGVPIGFAHAPHSHIEKYGCGRYSHWADGLIFSATDNSDPNTNGRRYSIRFFSIA